MPVVSFSSATKAAFRLCGYCTVKLDKNVFGNLFNNCLIIGVCLFGQLHKRNLRGTLTLLLSQPLISHIICQVIQIRITPIRFINVIPLVRGQTHARRWPFCCVYCKSSTSRSASISCWRPGKNNSPLSTRKILNFTKFNKTLIFSR